MNKSINIIGEPIENFDGRKLPLVKEVIAVFFYQKNILKADYKKSLRITIDKLEKKWSEAGIPTCGKKYALKKFEKILEEDKKLQKCSQRRRSATQKKNEAIFHQKLTNLFDIAKVNAEKSLTDDKKLFLSGQRSKSRFGLIENVVPLNSEENIEDAMDVEPVDTNEPEVNMALVTQKSAVFRSNLSATTSSHVSTDVSDFESQLSQPKPVPKLDVMTPELCATLDRAKVTHRNAIFILAAAFKSVGIDLSTLNLSYSTIYRARIKFRLNITKDLKSEFHKDDRYVVHWDGKILSDIKGTETVDRIAVLLSVSGVDQLLGVPKAEDGTALKQASVVIESLNQWEVAPYVRAMCFDTPPVNTGIHKGTCVLIEKALGRKLVWLPCRHHIMEIILRGVFEVFWKTTSGLNVPIFVRFKNYWDKVDQSNYKSGMEDETIANTLIGKKAEIVTFINNCLQAVHEFSGVRLPLQPYSGSHAVFMYSTASDGNVTLQLKEPDDLDRNSLAVMLARLQEDSSFSIYTQDTDILSDGGIDVLLGPGSSGENSGTDTVTASFDFFDSSSAHDLTLSPQTLSNTTEALINDNSNSLGLPADSDTVSTTTKDDGKPGSTSPEPKGKRPKTKPTSPNRQGPQQCTVCSKVFGNASALAKHKLTHSDERKYICTVCNKAFKRQDHLNGHMLTHRNKKPYECKADGCGKSYCDARSLRRHTENHHVPPPTSNSSTTMSPAQGAAAGDAASPHGSSCIQYAPPPTGSPTVKENVSKEGKSQLQQLLSTEPAKSVGGNNDGLTKQQLDLIHQIMEQTQRQNQTVSSPSSSKPSPKKSKSRSKDKTVAAASSTSWSPNSQHQQQCTQVKTISTGAPSPQGKVTTTTPSTPSPTQEKQPILKPVECNLCKRRFKNIPALNGHMRLHGGYFKKDPDTKKVDKKEQVGPPLQTASSSVRALIEEKIISKRNSSPITNHSSETIRHTSSATQVDMDPKRSSFVVPAPPQLVIDKNRRHSDAEALKSSKSYQEAQAIADLIVKREKISVKRTTSDPGQSSAHLLQYRSDSFSLDSVDMYQEEPQFVTPSLEDEVFSNNSMMLQGVDPNQLSQMPFQSESLDDNLLEIKHESLLDIKEEGLLDIKNEGDEDLQELSLDDIASLHEEPMTISQQSMQMNPVNQDLQAVLNSPLPESLAEFSTYHSSKNLGIQSPSYHTHSPGTYARSPHTFTAQSPLQSPMIRHDSPGFAYPTPPASHEGQSPCFGQNMSIPLVSPNEDFGQIVERGIDEPPQASSPLSAAFYTSTMSSSAAVEEAIQEILPGESITEDNLYPLSNTPPSQSENDSLGLTPVPSPRVSTSMPSPHPSNTYSTSPKTSSQASGLPNQWGSSPSTTLMLPNSDDPLLSSQPKDFVPKKRIQLNGVPVRLLSNHGLIELNSGNFTGLLVDANGELKLIQASGGNFPTKNFVLSNAQLVTTSSQEIGTKDGRVKVQKLTLTKAVPNTTATKLVTTNRSKLVNESRKEDCNNDVFLSPTTIPNNSPVRQARKRLRTEPLQLPVFHQSKLRTTRSKPQGSARYTPQPMLNPQRPGTGLYANIKYKFGEDGANWGDPIPETDSTPHINIGPQSQCAIPTYTSVPKRISPQPVYEDLLWDPGISNCTDSEIDMYLEFACCAAIPGGGRNKEYAMHLLHMCGGNIHDAMLRLMQPSPHLPADHPLLAYSYSESDKWTSAETELFHRCLLKFDKDFTRIAEEIKSKTVKQCIQFYYVWKKVCSDEYGRLKALRQMKRNHKNVSDMDDKPYPDVKLLGIADSESPMRNFLCEYPDCSASFNSRAALNGHIRIHGGTARNSPTPSVSDRRNTTTTSFTVSSTICHPDSTDQEYPCKICGKVFSKIKSRSAHMKSHRPPDAEPVKRRNSEPKEHKEPKESKDLSSSYEPSVPSPFSL